MKNIKTFDLREVKTPFKMNRTSVRAVIRKDNQYFLCFLEKTKEYKFPGGGVEKNETYEEALKREILEETGAHLSKVVKCLGYVDQVYPDKYIENEIFALRSIYYLCEIDSRLSKQKLSEKELYLGFKPEYVDIEIAINTNEFRIKIGSEYHWTERELYMLKYLKKLEE